jgi:uncharacterized membrane protein
LIKKLKYSREIIIVKLFATVSFIAFILFSSVAFAQISYYGIDTSLDKNGKSYIELTIIFSEIIDNLKFNFFGKIENFTASDNARCVVKVLEVSFIDCNLSLTEANKTVKIKFETNDFVKIAEDKFYFNGDFSLGKNIIDAVSLVKLPEGMVIVNDTIFPKGASTMTDGRRIGVVWSIGNVSSDQALKFQVMYEPTEKVSPLPFQQLIITVPIVAFVVAFFVYSRVRKPKEVILSVLDDYEKKVINIITAAGGEVNQKKVVQETNLSKAKVSRIVKNLVNRGLIEVKRLGRTNKLKLMKKKFEF